MAIHDLSKVHVYVLADTDQQTITNHVCTQGPIGTHLGRQATRFLCAYCLPSESVPGASEQPDTCTPFARCGRIKSFCNGIYIRIGCSVMPLTRLALGILIVDAKSVPTIAVRCVVEEFQQRSTL